MNKFKVILAPLVLTVALSGCGQYKSLAHDERYKNIHEVADSVDYTSAGEVVSEQYDQGDGVFSASGLEIALSGNKSFEILKQRILDLPDISNCTESQNHLDCRRESVYIYLERIESSESETVLFMTDSSNGRDSYEKNEKATNDNRNQHVLKQIYRGLTSK